MTLPPQAVAILDRLETFGVRLGLETTRKVLAALGRPERDLPVVLVAGTNGKGSTATLLAAMAAAAGYRTGLYTSPHLEEVEERVRIDGRSVPGERLGETLVRVVEAAETVLGHLPTYFEAMTAAALSLFAREDLDLVVLEVGLGGRLDATNATEPMLSLITEIGLEHRHFLGETHDSIAREKAGVLRAGRPAIAWTRRPEVERAISGVARQLGAELAIGPRVARVEAAGRGTRGGQRVVVATGEAEHQIELGLPGEHQADNLALAVLAAEELRRRGWKRLDGAALARGAAAARWPGRLERVALPGGGEVLLDAAHNADGAVALERFLGAFGRPYDLLFGALADKELEGVLPRLAAGAARVVLTAPASPRAARPEALAELLGGRRQVVVEPAIGRALSVAVEGGAGRLVSCGSIYLIGEVRKLLRQRFGAPPAARAMPLYPSSA